MVYEKAEKLDLSDLKCPEPIMRTRLKMDSIIPGSRILVVVSDLSFKIDLEVFLNQSGNVLVKSWHENNLEYFLIERK